MSSDSGLDIAVVGMSGRFPGARDLDQFWSNLANGVESITRFSDEILIKAGVPASHLADHTYVKAAPILEEPGAFDAEFFAFTPREAEVLDPQHRLLLELAHEALENAGCDPARYPGRVGVFTGAAMNTYVLDRGIDKELGQDYIPTLIGTDKDFLSTRISYKLNLRGPSLTVQTACSTSLVAVHLARQSLLSHETDMALAGGVSVRVPHCSGYFHDAGGVTSSDGRVRAFDAKANGTVFGSGGGILVLKRLDDALADGDFIHAIIKGSAVNNDGAEKAGYTAPSVNGQADAVVEALANAGVDAESISYVEAHGSGTPVGDPIELRALTKAFRVFTQRSQYCAIGSVKTNLGHLDAAAAVAGIIKTVLALKNRQLPASLNYSDPNPEIDFPNTPFYVNTALREWISDGPRRAGVMATGMGGTNAHLVLEEAPPARTSDRTEEPDLLLWSARTESGLEQSTRQLNAFLLRNESINLTDVADTLQDGRKAFRHRRFAICRDRTDALRALGDASSRGMFSGAVLDSQRRPIVFLFPGIGDHYVGMGHELYTRFAEFRTAVDSSARALGPYLGCDIREILYPARYLAERAASNGRRAAGIDLKKMLARETSETEDPDSSRLNATLFAQPALFTVEYALARLWESLGIVPDAVVGHSMGEYTAACLAGVLSLEQAARLVAVRARLVNELPQAAMLAVLLSEDELRPLLSTSVSIALINGPGLCVVAGPPEEVAALEKGLAVNGVVCRPVKNAHAFHTPALEPIANRFGDEVLQVQLHSPRIPCLSNVTGQWLTAEEAVDPAYWVKHATHTSRFSDGLQQLWKLTDPVLLEAGPGRTLTVLATQHPGRKNAKSVVAVSSLRHQYENQPDLEVLLRGAGGLWLSGAEIKWPALSGERRRRRIPLPTYPFERTVHWAARSPEHKSPAQHPAPAAETIDEWFYTPSWERTTALNEANGAAVDSTASWLIVTDGLGEGAGLKSRFDKLDLRVNVACFGQEFFAGGDGIYELNPHDRGDYVKLLRAVAGRTAGPLHIIHFGGYVKGRPAFQTTAFETSQAYGFFSLLYLAQAIGELNLSNVIKIGIISNRLHQVTGEETLDPTMATVLGPCGVIPKEFPNVSCFNIDLPDGQSVDSLPDQWVSAILEEFSDKDSNRVVAYRGRFRWLRNYRRAAPLPPADTAGTAFERLRRGGVYLITGGTGGIGLAIAKYLAEACQPKLVLTKRAPFPEKRKWNQLATERGGASGDLAIIDQLLELEQLGAQVEVVSAECADRAQMKKVLDWVDKTFGPVDGVIHAAGVVHAGLIQAKTRDTANRVLAPKVEGTRVLFDLFSGRRLDFFVLFSSMAAIDTPFAQVDYAAANAFLDAFAWFSSAHNQYPTIAINWPGWQRVGMLARLETLPGLERWKQDALGKAIATEKGVAAFARLLNSKSPQVVVSPQDLGEALREATALDASRYFAPYSEMESVRARPATDEWEPVLTQIWREALGIEHIGPDDNFFELGGHSLIAARIVSTLDRKFGKRLSVLALFRTPTIAGLAATLRGAAAPHTVPLNGPVDYRNCLIWFGGGAILRPFAGHLGNHTPVVMLTMPEQNVAAFKPPYAFANVAKSLACRILELDPQGPYLVGGWCLMGLLAYETAHQLELMGKEVNLVVLLDTPLTINSSAVPLVQRARQRLKGGMFHLSRLWQMPRSERASYLRTRLEWLKVLLRNRRLRNAYAGNREHAPRDRLFEEILFLSALNYAPPPYGGRVLSLRPQERPKDPYADLSFDWKKLVRTLECFEVPGDHGSMLHEPNARVLADRIRLAIDASRSSRQGAPPAEAQSAEDRAQAA